MKRHILEAFLNGDAAALLAGAAALLGGAKDAFNNFIKDAGGWEGIQDWLISIPGEGYKQASDMLKTLAESFESFGDDVVGPIGDAINEILDTGDVAPQADGGLGETHDIFTPEGEGIPNVPVGEIPGVGSEGGGMNRDEGGGGYGDSAGGGGSSGGGGTTPLGDSPEPSAPDPSGNQPTAEDLGVPDGSYIETRPDGTVQITYPDGTVEVRTWP